MNRRIMSGIYGLDKILGGGFIENTVNAVLGGPGSGKTIFCMNFILEGLENGNRCLYASPDLDADDFLRLAASMYWDLSGYLENGQLEVEMLSQEDVPNLLKNVLRYDRIVVDSISPIVVDMDSKERKNLNWFLKNLKANGTALITVEEPVYRSEEIVVFLADSIINLKYTGYGGPYSRTLRVLKHRMSWHGEGVYPFYIINGVGIVVDERRGEGFEVEELDLPEIAMEKIRDLCRRGALTREDVEKIKRRVAWSKG
ncbi:RAD55 family ATPase [Archaeoglobus neptunius]|uniref:RAD55 family ATPase n=1 Tax=Archaeoglobus neptunius TaxID=2798580 RepID=UPI0019268399|nr:RAD55 family ATPase [Archaeoglobus neptunius]